MNHMRFLIGIIAVSSLLSCNNSELTQEIEQLKKENITLKDSLERLNHSKIVSSELLLIPHTLSFKLNQKNTVSGIFYQNTVFLPYDLFLADENFKFEEKDKINYRLQKDNKFEFDFIPKKREDETVRVVAVFDLDTVKVNLYGRTDLPVK